MTTNECENCQKNCCINFKLTQEIRHPLETKEELSKYHFIHRTSSEIIIIDGHERAVGIYNCDRFNLQTGLCTNYEERPEFCKNTGIIFRPHEKCILKRQEIIYNSE